MSDDLMTIRQMCDAFDVTPRALRFYESKELLSPLRDGQKRLFSRRDRARLKLILRGKRFGFSLEDIRQLLDLYDMGGKKEVQLREVVAAARARLAELQRTHDELGQAIDDLSGQIAWGENALKEMQKKSVT